jgi:hypothetical protein
MTEGQNYGMQPGDNGDPPAVKCKNLGEILRALSYIFNKKDNHGIISMLAEANTVIRSKNYDRKKTEGRDLVRKEDMEFLSTSSEQQDIKKWSLSVIASIDSYDKFERMAHECEDTFFKEIHRKLIHETGQCTNRRELKSFYNMMSEQKFYTELRFLWKIRDSLGVSTLNELVEFIFSDQSAREWIHGWVCAMVCTTHFGATKRKDVDPYLVGDTAEVYLRCTYHVYNLLPEEYKARFMQYMLPSFISYWFSARNTNCEMIHVISKGDFDKRMQDSNSFPDLDKGIFIVVLRNDYNIIKREKKASTDDSADMKLKLSEVSDKDYPFLRTLIPEIHRRYEDLLGCKVTAESIEQRNYISHENTLYEDGNIILQNHTFPMVEPAFVHGSVKYIGVNVPILRETQRVNTTPLKLRAQLDFSAGNSEPSKKQREVIKSLSGRVNGVETTFSFMKFPNKDLKSMYARLRTETNNTASIDPCMEKMQQVVENALKGKIDFDGYTSECDVSKYMSEKEINHLRVATQKGCVYEYKFLGRYNRGNVMAACVDELKDINGQFEEFLKEKEKELRRKENHLTRKILRDNYKAFKSERLLPFTRFGGTYGGEKSIIERLSSHPTFPTWDNRPDTFVWYEDTGGLLEDRCEYFRLMNCKEQSAQIFFLRMWYELRSFINEFIEEKFVSQGIPATPSIGIVRYLKNMEKIMKAAQERHAVKYPRPSILARTLSMVEKCLSPKRKRDDEGGPSKRFKPE